MGSSNIFAHQGDLLFDDSRTTRLIIADDHEIVRAGVRRLLSIDKSLYIIDEASNGADAVEMVKYHKPDIALLDIMMPRMDGIEAAGIIKREVPETLVVILTAYEDSTHLDKALEAGADGYLVKDIGAKKLVEALHNVLKGERVFSRTVLKLLEKKYFTYDKLETEQVSITNREQTILNYIAKGKTSKEIADILCISLRTVQSHRSNIMQKLEIKNSAGLVRYAVLNYDRNNSSVVTN